MILKCNLTNFKILNINIKREKLKCKSRLAIFLTKLFSIDYHYFGVIKNVIYGEFNELLILFEYVEFNRFN